MGSCVSQDREEIDRNRLPNPRCPLYFLQWKSGKEGAADFHDPRDENKLAPRSTPRFHRSVKAGISLIVGDLVSPSVVVECVIEIELD